MHIGPDRWTPEISSTMKITSFRFGPSINISFAQYCRILDTQKTKSDSVLPADCDYNESK